MSLFNLVPSEGPRNVEVQVLSSHSVLVTWQPPRLSEQNGVIAGYSVQLTALQSGNIEVYNLSRTASSQQIEGML